MVVEPILAGIIPTLFTRFGSSNLRSGIVSERASEREREQQYLTAVWRRLVYERMISINVGVNPTHLKVARILYIYKRIFHTLHTSQAMWGSAQHIHTFIHYTCQVMWGSAQHIHQMTHLEFNRIAHICRILKAGMNPTHLSVLQEISHILTIFIHYVHQAMWGSAQHIYQMTQCMIWT